MRKLLFVITVVMLSGLSGNSLAGDVVWGYDSLTSPDHLWSTGDNWNTGGQPVGGDVAWVVKSASEYCLIDSTVTAVASTTNIGSADAGGALLKMTGGSLASATALSMGTFAGDAGTFDFSNGSVTCGRVFVGQNGSGTFNMSDGTLNGTLFTGGYQPGASGVYNHSDGTATYSGTAWLGYKAPFRLNMTGGEINFLAVTDLARLSNSNPAHVQLDDGVIYIHDRIYMRRFQGSATMSIDDGVMVVKNRNWTGTFQGYIDNNWITASGDKTTVVTSYDGTDTYLFAVPEPVTFALLGFGGLALMYRRRK